jgi:hypothetical protein
VKRTRPLLLVLYAVFGGALGWVLQVALTASGAPAAIPPYSLAFALVVIGVLVVVAARPVRRAVRDRTRPRIDPFYATRVVILAKAIAIAGSVLFGAGFGVLLFFLTRPVIAGVGSIVACVVTVVAAAVLLTCGLVAEYMCSLPPDDDNDRGDRSPVTTTPH